MRINKFLAQATGISRRQADQLIQMRKVRINQQVANLGDHVTANDKVYLEGKTISLPLESTIIMLNKPVGYVCSRNGQGSKSIYDLLPADLSNLKPVGRLDKDSSGLLIMTDDGQQAHELMHPKFSKDKTYQVIINKSLNESDRIQIEKGIQLSDGISKLKLSHIIGSEQKNRGVIKTIPDSELTVTMSEGRNRQIRRTFSALGYRVVSLHRTRFGNYVIGSLAPGKYKRAEKI